MILTEKEKRALIRLCFAIEQEREGNKAIDDIINVPDSLIEKLRSEAK